MNSNHFSITANLVNILQRNIQEATITIENRKIKQINIKGEENKTLPYILPGFIDSHIHIESSMLVPSEFARLAVVHGTVATISDPHEIANVCGIAGVHYMIENGKQTPFKFNFGAPSCVPATVFETAGASLDVNAVTELLSLPDIKYLSEMMNFPGVLHKDPEVMQKIAAAHQYGKPVDGHAPGLRGTDAQAYIESGISTDHECFTIEEALDKLTHGMKIIIREGSAAKNFEALYELIDDHPNDIMLCSDDKHPDSLVDGHINQLCARAVAKGIDVFHVLKAACINPVKHYKLDVGLLREGDAADCILIKDLEKFTVLQTYIDGLLVAENGRSFIPSVPATIMNAFNCQPVNASQLAILQNEYPIKDGKIAVMEALDGQLITNKLWLTGTAKHKEWISDTQKDILKIVVVNRYHNAPITKAFIKNMGLQEGAIASTVAHDSHNIVAVGVDDESLAKAINLLIEVKGGVSAVSNSETITLPLPVAGLMSTDDGYAVAEAYTKIDAFAKTMGSTLSAPYMTLSFMALLVIPHIKISDKGLFDGDGFCFIE
jgi:adenine deaminase